MARSSLKLTAIRFLEKIAQHPKRTSLQRKLREQLAKDLNENFTEIPQSDLLPWLSEWLNGYLHQRGDLGQLLYRVDIAETHWRGKSRPAPLDLAKAILEREAQKVIFRAQYSGEI